MSMAAMRAFGTCAKASSVIGRMLIDTAIRGLRMGSVNLQLRGAWMAFQGHGSMNAPTICITGALRMQGGATLRLLNSRDQLKKRIVVLIERVSPISVFWLRARRWEQERESNPVWQKYSIALIKLDLRSAVPEVLPLGPRDVKCGFNGDLTGLARRYIPV